MGTDFFIGISELAREIDAIVDEIIERFRLIFE
jgi:hypothetical protein